MKIAIGADHHGVNLKNYIIKNLEFTWEDVGCFSLEICDYPIYSKLVCELILQGKVDCGILLCGTGIGMAMAANRFKKIYAALAWNVNIARLSKEEDNSNVLVLPADFITFAESIKIIQSWTLATFKGGNYLKRIKLLD